MHKDFGDWHREAGLEPNSQTAPAHWKVITEYEPNAEEVIALARYFYGFGTPASLEDFGTALQDADPSFSMQKHTRLLRVLAGAMLIDLTDPSDDQPLAELAGLALLSGAAQGTRDNVPVASMVERAARYVESQTSKRASRENDSEATDADAKLRSLQRELMIVGEETNILWWLISEYSRDQDAPWKTLGMPAGSVIAGKELADLTRVVPGPVAAAALLDRVVACSNSGKPAKPIKLMSAINATPRRWRDVYPVAPPDLTDLMPVSRAIKLSMEIDEHRDWSALFQKGTGISADARLAPNRLAYQVFLERMLARLPGELE